MNGSICLGLRLLVLGLIVCQCMTLSSARKRNHRIEPRPELDSLSEESNESLERGKPAYTKRYKDNKSEEQEKLNKLKNRLKYLKKPKNYRRKGKYGKNVDDNNDDGPEHRVGALPPKQSQQTYGKSKLQNKRTKRPKSQDNDDTSYEGRMSVEPVIETHEIEEEVYQPTKFNDDSSESNSDEVDIRSEKRNDLARGLNENTNPPSSKHTSKNQSGNSEVANKAETRGDKGGKSLEESCESESNEKTTSKQEKDSKTSKDNMKASAENEKPSNSSKQLEKLLPENVAAVYDIFKNGLKQKLKSLVPYCPELHFKSVVTEWGQMFKNSWPKLLEMGEKSLGYAKELKLQLGNCVKDFVNNQLIGGDNPNENKTRDSNNGRNENVRTITFTDNGDIDDDDVDDDDDDDDGFSIKIKRESLSTFDPDTFLASVNKEYINPIVEYFEKLPEMVIKVNSGLMNNKRR